MAFKPHSRDNSSTNVSMCVEKYFANHIIHCVLQFNAFFFLTRFFFFFFPLTPMLKILNYKFRGGEGFFKNNFPQTSKFKGN